MDRAHDNLGGQPSRRLIGAGRRLDGTDRRPAVSPKAGRWRRRRRVAASRGLDGFAWITGLIVAVFARYDFTMTYAQLTATLTAGVCAVCVHSTVGHRQFLYRGRYSFGTFEEVRAVFATVCASSLIMVLADLTLPVRLVPASAPLIGGAVALVIMLGIRYLRRLAHERALRPDASCATRVLLFGAGRAGRELLRSMMHDPRGRYLPVGLLDDDPDKRHLRVCGIPVLGDRDALPHAVSHTDAREVIFAVASADAATVRHIRQLTLACGANFKVLPSVSELLDDAVGVADVRDVQVEDLLGRHQIGIDVAAIASYLKGKRVLVTGAGGSIGSELCRQLDAYGPAELIMLDRDESALHAVSLSMRGRALLDGPELVLADIRDAEAIETIFAERDPQVVFHAAALKHLPLLERYPVEAVKTNIWGTLTVLHAARHVERFVNVSTDKAANPISVLGYSKRITERLTAHAAAFCPGTFLSVRFGNVLGSRGSALTAFAAQAAAGGPITVTDPEVSRFFMTVREAVQLMIQAAAIGQDGEALVLDMGRPVRIAELAQHVAEQSGRPINIVYTGLRPGEKLHEELFGPGETDVRPRHPLVSHVTVPPLDPEAVRQLDEYASPAAAVKAMASLCHGSAGVTAQRSAAA